MSATLPGEAGVSARAFVFQWLERVYCSDALARETGGKTALQLAGALASAADYPNGGGIRRSVETLAKGTGMSERVVKDALQFLTARGYLETTARGGSRGRSGGGTATRRRLTLPESGADTRPRCAESGAESWESGAEFTESGADTRPLPSPVRPAPYRPTPLAASALEVGGKVDDHSHDAPSFLTDDDHMAALERITDRDEFNAYYLEHRADLRGNKALIDAATERRRALLHSQMC